MKSYINKKTIKNLIISVAIIAILSTLVPPIVRAKTNTEDGGGILHPIEDFVLFLGDKVMGWLQNTFISMQDIEVEEGKWEFLYSPAIIFSGDVPAFDINFINPGPSKIGTITETDFISLMEALDLNGAKQIYSKQYAGAGLSNLFVTKNGIIKDIQEDAQYEYNASNEVNVSELEGSLESLEEDNPDIYLGGSKWDSEANTLEKAWYNNDKTKMYIIVDYYYLDTKIDQDGFNSNQRTGIIYLYEMDTSKNLNDATGITGTVIDKEVGTKVYESTAGKLQTTIATWYNALRRIALVGLLSVLVYVGIRMVTSSSAGEKAKYKSMMKDWIVAICLLFTLHYIMSITITVTNEVSNILIPGESDELLNTLRGEIYSDDDSGIILAKTIMYITIVILTVSFTIQYLKRVIFMAFYTLIAPLITLTYPLDKIKDGQAQAFTMWIREYIYTALTQVIHLVIYTVLVGSALDLVSTYPLYAIIVMFFIKKADGIIKKMFGFDKSETVGTLGAAATGALVVNALNKLGRKKWWSKKEWSI